MWAIFFRSWAFTAPTSWCYAAYSNIPTRPMAAPRNAFARSTLAAPRNVCLATVLRPRPQQTCGLVPGALPPTPAMPKRKNSCDRPFPCVPAERNVVLAPLTSRKGGQQLASSSSSHQFGAWPRVHTSRALGRSLASPRPRKVRTPLGRTTLSAPPLVPSPDGCYKPPPGY